MPDNLEKISEENENVEISLGKELSNSIRNYPSTFKNYFKQLAPAIVISSIGSAAGQYLANKFGYDSNAALTAAAYICGYIPGYSYFFSSEYRTNRENYPKFLSKEFGKFVSTFMAADYVADITTFTPAFIASNIWMTENTDINPALRSVIAWNAAAFLYMGTISALHPLSRRITDGINNNFKKIVGKIKRKNKTSTPQ